MDWLRACPWKQASCLPRIKTIIINSMFPLLQLDGVGVRLGGRQVLSDVSFTVGKGEFAAIIGPNGAGKTTLIRAILGLRPTSAGRIIKAASGTTGAAGPGGHRPGAAGQVSIGYVPQKIVIDSD